MADPKPLERRVETGTSTRFIRPEERTSALSDEAITTREQISSIGKREGWRVLFAGDPETIEELARNAYIEISDFVYKLNDLNGSFVKEVRERISDLNAEVDAVVFCTSPEDLEAFRSKHFTFENRFYPPVIHLSDTPIKSERRLLNVWYIDTKGRDLFFLKQQLTEAIKAGKNFVDFVKKAALLIMASNPEDYADLKRRNPNTVYVVPATEEGYYQAKAYLDSIDLVVDEPNSRLKGRTYSGKDVFVGGVAIDGIDTYQMRLSLRLDNESHLKGIPLAYVGNDDPRVNIYLKPQLERFRVIRGEDIKQKGLMRLLEDYDPSKGKVEAQVNVHYDPHIVVLRGRHKSLTATFEDSEMPVDPAAETQKINYDNSEEQEFLENLRRITAEVEAEQEQKKKERDAVYDALEKFYGK